jgi:hypothetical protein
VNFSDSATIDAFGRLRVGNPQVLFDTAQQYGDSALLWENTTSGTGAVSNLLNSSSVQMSTGGTLSGAKVIRSSRVYHRYQPGMSLHIVKSFVPCGTVSNLRQRYGYFDASNGLFLENDGTGWFFVRRTNVTGTPVDTRVAQANWNIDKMDGTGRSGVTLDFTKSTILETDLQWLGHGRVRLGFSVGGQFYYAHQFLNANSLSAPYMSTACLPIRFELENTGATSGTNTVMQTCAAIISEGGFDVTRGLPFATANAVAGISVTTRRPILTVRAKTTGPNSVRNTGHIYLAQASVACTNNSSLIEIVQNGTLTGASFSAVNSTYSLADVDTSATTISGGVVTHAFVAPAGSGTNNALNTQFNEFQLIPLVYSALGNVQDTVTLVATSQSGTSNCIGMFGWKEVY